MEEQLSLARNQKVLLCYALGVVLVWTLVLLGLGLFSYQDHLNHVKANTIEQARDTFNKDLIFRRWVAGHGGVYVTPTVETPPNPYLSHLPRRDLTTSDDQPLTLVNPAYMMRQVHELGLQQFGFRGHITSLKPLRPENRPDAWEERALNSFAGGVKEVVEEALIEGRPFMRCMKPLFVEERCLKCHAVQGYQVGELRGGTSVSIDMGPFLARYQQHMNKILSIYLFLWLAGLLAIYLAFLHNQKLIVKSAESVLQMSLLRRRYENILAAAGEGIIGLDRDYLHDFVNPAAEKMLGYTQAELLGVPSHQSWHAFKAEDEAYPLAQCPICQAMINCKEVQNYHDQFMRKDGTFFPVEISVSPIIENGLGLGAVVVFQDISERLAAEVQIKRLAGIIEQTHSGVLIVALDGLIEYVNPGYEKLSGYTTAEILGRDPRELFFTDEHQTERQELWEAISQARNWRGVLASRHKNGAIVYEDTTGFPLFDGQGKIINYAVIKHDVTQAQKLQEQLFQAQKMESIGNLAGGVAHDFNNLLTVINSFSETLIDECGEDSLIRQDLLEINEAGRRAADLTRQLLAFSRRQIIQPRELCLRKLIENLMKMMRRLLSEDIDLKFDLPETAVRVKADPGQFEQVIINLLVNARDALHQNEVAAKSKKITLRLTEIELDDDFVVTHEGSRPGRQALIEISDNGCGMNRENQKHCFEPFYTTKELGQGTGLGLSTVYGIVKQNDAFITLDSESGQGTTIRIYWPLCQAEGVVVEPEIKAPRKNFSHSKGATILLVEDDEKIREIAGSRLAKAGFQMIIAADGQEALSQVEAGEKTPDLLFTDMVMPGMGCRELSRQLKERYPGLLVLYSSGYTDDSTTKELGDGEAFLRKPYTIKALLAAISRLLDVD